MVASCVPPTGDPARNPGMCLDWESNWRPFGSQAGTQSTEPHEPGLRVSFLRQMFLGAHMLVSTGVKGVTQTEGRKVKRWGSASDHGDFNTGRLCKKLFIQNSLLFSPEAHLLV